jgi:hypothetical protein
MQNITDALLGSLRSVPREQPAIAIIGDLNYDWIYSCPRLEPGKEVLISTYSRDAGWRLCRCGLARLGARGFVTDRAPTPRARLHGKSREGSLTAIRLKAGLHSPYLLR